VLEESWREVVNAAAAYSQPAFFGSGFKHEVVACLS